VFRATLINVLLVDNHRLAHVGMRHLINAFPDFRFVGVARCSEEALDLTAQLAPDVIVIELRMVGSNTVVLTTALRMRHPHIPIVVLIADSDQHLSTQLMDYGATVCVSRDVSAHDLAQILRTVVATPQSSSYAQAPASHYADEASEGSEFELTETEVFVLQCLAQEFSNEQIAQYLQISRSSVKHHINEVMLKLGVNRRIEAILVAREYGLI
jgi:DNA-binding NarL/FixJ family response regulator